MKVLIIDDEPIAQEILEKFSARVPYLQVLQSCDNAIEALQAIRDLKPDLIFLDIQMPEMTGIEMLRSLRNSSPLVIFTTAYHDYALDGFELDAIDYLLKPIPIERFLKAVDKAHERYQFKNQVAGRMGFINNNEKEYVWVREGKKLVQICIKDIVLVLAMGDYMEVFLPNTKVIVHITMANLEAYLKAPEFLRVNRSCIIRKNAILSIEDRQIESILSLNERITIGPTYWEDIKAHLKEWF